MVIEADRIVCDHQEWANPGSRVVIWVGEDYVVNHDHARVLGEVYDEMGAAADSVGARVRPETAHLCHAHDGILYFVADVTQVAVSGG